MAIAVTAEQEELAAAVQQFGTRYAPIGLTRDSAESTAAGNIPSWWAKFVEQGFHAVHLPEEVGGQGGGLDDMACVVEAAGAAGISGPLLSTATAGAVLTAAVVGNADAPEIAEILGRLAAGDTAAIVFPGEGEFRAAHDGAGLRVDGVSGLTLGVCSAQWVLIPVALDDALTWCLIDTTSPRVKREAQRGTDLSCDVGVLHLVDYVVDEGGRLAGLDTERVRCVVAAFVACTSAGALRWAVEATTDYLRIREQFGRPIGTFQGLQHRAATLLVNAELAAAAAWDAVRATAEPLEQHRMASCAAVLMAVAPAPDLLLDALTMHGAIGYTWEHELQVYWRRVIAVSGSLGQVTRWADDMGELIGAHRRVFALNALGESEADFRAEVAGVLDRAEALDNTASSRQESERREFDTGPRRTLLADEGLVAPYLPAPWGREATPLQQLVVSEEFAKRPTMPRPRLGIAEWIVPTILTAGTEALRERFAGPTLRGEIGWCQLFSEPGAGSDLANLSTRAMKVDGGWRIQGQKVWTSLADNSDYGALLARSDPDQPKHRGLSYFIIDMTSEGLDVRPIKQASGRAEFCEVFFNDVFVPDDMLVGAPGEGWSLAIATMAQERAVISNFVEIDRAGSLRHIVETGERRDSAAARAALADIDSYTNALKALVLRETLRLAQGQVAGAASSVAKYAFSVLLRKTATATLKTAGQRAMIEGSEPPVIKPYLELPAELIGGGTTEIQLTIIATMLMGLPRK